MKALILNSGTGSRMGEITKTHPKCMTELIDNETILSRQLKLLKAVGINKIVITTGPFHNEMLAYCNSLNLGLDITFVNNPDYAITNYIYSVYCAKDKLIDDDIIMMHGDLIFTEEILSSAISYDKSCMIISKTLPLPEKDFKAVIEDGHISKVGIECFDNAYAAEPLYKIKQVDWLKWLAKMIEFCEQNNRKCYGENAFNEISDECLIYGLDIGNKLCMEVDNVEDLKNVRTKLKELKK